jgi:hypothetical protein
MPLELSLSEEEFDFESEITIKINYDAEVGSAARIFEIAADLIHSLEDMDRVFSQSIHFGLETALVVEDLEKSSLKIFLKNVLRGIPDDALKDVEVRKLIGHYLVKAKYAALRWLDKPEDKDLKITDLTEEIERLARETDIRHLPDYPPPNAARLAQPLDRFQETKKKFTTNESLIITLGKDEYRVHLDSTWMPSEHTGEIEADKELVNEQDVFLIIGKPDLIGNTKWYFRHGKRPLSLKIEDEAWLSDFHSRKYSISPGDALRVRLRVEHHYDNRGNLIRSDERIVKVFEIIEGSGETDRLL